MNPADVITPSPDVAPTWLQQLNWLHQGETGPLTNVLITFFVIILIIYLINMLPIVWRAKLIVRIIVIIIGVLSLVEFSGIKFSGKVFEVSPQLPQSQATGLNQDKEPITLSVNDKGQVFLQNAEISVDDLIPKLQAVAQARGGTDARIYVRGDKKVDYGTMMKVMGRLSAAGFHNVALVTDPAGVSSRKTAPYSDVLPWPGGADRRATTPKDMARLALSKCLLNIEPSPDLEISNCTSVIQSGNVSGEMLAKVFYGRGAAYNRTGQYDSAIQDFNQAIKLQPNNVFAINDRGNAYNNKGQYDRAIQDFDHAIKLDPSSASVFSNRGNSYLAKGQYDRAIQDYEQAIKLNPNSAFAFGGRGFAYANKGQMDRAILDYDQAIRLNPNLANTIVHRGFAYANKGQYDRAIQDYDQAIRLNPNDAEALSDRGNAYNSKGQYERAIQDFDQAITLNPKNAETFYNRGIAKKKKGDEIGAAADIATAKSINPNIGR